jgi:peptidoglycan/LPS O-acetylase OafA/YrhL
LLKEHARIGSISLREFYLRRAYRILPAAYTFMVVVIVAHWRALPWPNILTAVTYTSNYSHGGNWLLGHLWSLSVDEQFYLLWPLTLLLVFRRRLWIIADLVIAGPSLRVLFGMLWGHRGLEHPFPVVMDALAAGGALAMMQPYLRRYDHPLRQRQFLIVPCLTALMPLIQFVSNCTYQVAGLTILHLGIALSIQHAVHVRYRSCSATACICGSSLS